MTAVQEHKNKIANIRREMRKTRSAKHYHDLHRHLIVLSKQLAEYNYWQKMAKGSD